MVLAYCSVKGHRDNVEGLLIPVQPGVRVERGKYKGKDSLQVATHQVDDIFVVPEE